MTIEPRRGNGWAHRAAVTVAIAAAGFATLAGGCGGSRIYRVDSNGEAFEELLIYLNDPIVPLKTAGGTHYSGTTGGTFFANVRSDRSGGFQFTTSDGAILSGRLGGGNARAGNWESTREFATSEVRRLAGQEIDVSRASFLGIARRARGNRIVLRGKLTFRGTAAQLPTGTSSPVHGRLNLDSTMRREM